VAELQLEGGELVLHLSGWEKAETVHGDLRMPLSALRGVEVLDDARGWGGSGAGYKIGMPGHGGKMFVAVHAGTVNGQVTVPAGGQLKVPTPRVDHFLFRVVPPRARAWRMR
jgi:hypothetical protein